MKPTIFLHIGTTKTGTSTIQRTLLQQYKALLALGVLYPVTGREGTNAHHELRSALALLTKSKDSDKALAVNQVAKMQKALLREIKNTQCKHVIFSSEFFVQFGCIESIQEFFAGFEVKIVIYFRRHDSWWESEYNQSVKSEIYPTWQPGFENYLQFQKQSHFKGNYQRLANRWARVFGKENIIIRPFEACQNQPNLLVDFFNALGLSQVADKIDLIPAQTNKSLSFFTLNLIDTYKRANISPEIRSLLIKHAKSISDGSERGSISSPALRRKLIDENRRGYEYIAKEYLGRKDGRLFYEPLPDVEDDWEEPKSPTLVEIVEHTVQAMQQVNFKFGLVNLYKHWRS